MRFPKLPGHSVFKDPWAMTVLAGAIGAFHFDHPYFFPAVKDVFVAAVDDYQRRTEMADIFSGTELNQTGFISAELTEDYTAQRHARNLISTSIDAEFEPCGAMRWPVQWLGAPDEESFSIEGDARAVVAYTHYELEYIGQEYGFIQILSDSCEDLDLEMNGIPVFSH